MKRKMNTPIATLTIESGTVIKIYSIDWDGMKVMVGVDDGHGHWYRISECRDVAAFSIGDDTYYIKEFKRVRR